MHDPVVPLHRPCPEQLPIPLHPTLHVHPYWLSEHGSHFDPPYPARHTHVPLTQCPRSPPPQSTSPTHTGTAPDDVEQSAPDHPK